VSNLTVFQPPVGPPAAPSKPPWWKRRWVLAAGAVVVILSVIGALVGEPEGYESGREAGSSESANSGDEGETVATTSIDVGDCLLSLPTLTHVVLSAELVPCDDSHAFETFADVDLPFNGAYPGDDELNESTERLCNEEFAGYVGLPLGLTPFQVSFLYPTEGSWDELDDRSATCLVRLPAPGAGSARDVDLSDGWHGVDVPSGLEPGQCIAPDGDLPALLVELVACAQPHSFEALGSTTVDEPDFPGNERLVAQAEAFCRQTFRAYVGIDLEQSALEVVYTTPPEENWALGDHTLACFVRSGGESGSVAGTQR
jgi:Septum formation